MRKQMVRCVVPILIVFLCISEPAYSLNSIVVKQGEVAIFSLPAEKGLSGVVGQYGKKVIPFFRYGDRFLALISADMRAKVGTRRIVLKKIYLDEGKGYRKEKEEKLYVKIERTKFGFQRFNATIHSIKTPALMERLKKEREEVEKVLSLITAKKWEGSFVHPLKHSVPGRFFGFERVINGIKSSPHTGADYPAPLGSKIRAINRGKVVLVARHYFAGRCVYIDHGMGLISMYFHMDRVYVHQGQMVEKGQVIGTVGSTGRTTAPHLHLGVRLQKDRIDPNRLMELNLD